MYAPKTHRFRAGREDYYIIAVRCTDALIILLGGLTAFFWRHGSADIAPPYWAAVAIAIVGLQACAEPFTLYDYRRLMTPTAAGWSALVAWSVVLSGLVLLAYFLKISDGFSRTWAMGWATIVAVGMVGVRVAAARHLTAALAEGQLAARVVILGTAAACQRLQEMIGHDPGICLVGTVVADAVEEPEQENREALPQLGRLSDLPSLCLHYEIDEIAVIGPIEQFGPVKETLAILRATPAQVRLCLDPALAGTPMTPAEPLGALPSAVPTVALFTPPLRGSRYLAKEAEDVVLGALLGLLALPILLVAALAIRLEGPGPILFPQLRGGFGGKSFVVYKLRTMHPSAAADAHAVQAAPGDPRVTRVGRLLRRYSIDELPQLWNVMKREMSLVGPRPHALPHDDHYGGLIDSYAARRKMKPGLTGWAQVNGLRGLTAQLADMEARVRHDLYYIENWSLGFDLRILVATLYRVFADRDAY